MEDKHSLIADNSYDCPVLDTAKGKVKKKALKRFLGWSALWGTVSAAWSGTMIFTSISYIYRDFKNNA